MSLLEETREKFDTFRTTFKGGRIQMSLDFYELPAEVKGKILYRIANYTAFDKDGYHDAGLIIFGDWPVRWRIEERTEGLVLDIALAE